MTDEKIINRLQFFTCEWLNRPDYAISEFSETMVKNMAVLEKYKGKIIPDKVVDVFSSNLEPIMDSLRRFDSKNTDAPGEPTVEDLAEVMKFLEGNDQLDSFMNRVFEASGAMFLMSINYLVATTLLWNPQEMASRTFDGLSSKAFKENPSRTQLKNYLTSTIFPRSTGRNRTPDRAERSKRVSMWDNLGQEDDDDDNDNDDCPLPVRGRTQSRGRTGRPAPTKSPVIDSTGYLLEKEDFQERPLTAKEKGKRPRNSQVSSQLSHSPYPNQNQGRESPSNSRGTAKTSQTEVQDDDDMEFPIVSTSKTSAKRKKTSAARNLFNDESDDGVTAIPETDEDDVASPVVKKKSKSKTADNETESTDSTPSRKSGKQTTPQNTSSKKKRKHDKTVQDEQEEVLSSMPNISLSSSKKKKSKNKQDQ